MRSTILTILTWMIVFGSGNVLKAQFQLSGTVTDTEGKPVPFAALQLKNTFVTVQSNEKGDFEFKNLQPGFYKIIVHCLGFENYTDSLQLSANSRISPVLKFSSKNLEEVPVLAGRVGREQGVAHSNVDAEYIRTNNLGQDAPIVLNQLTGVVANSDAGNGVGYTGIRIRGSDPTRINVTINGVPINDAESQGSYFVDMPDLLSSVNSVQVQRGLGTSVNGAGAFGASINFETQTLKEKPYAGIISTAGSYKTFRNTVMAGSGLINKCFVVDARASYVKSQGYIDRASSDLRSYYLSAALYKGKSIFKFVNFYGKEKTYQAWYYVAEDSVKNGNRTYNMAGAYTDADGQIKYHDNETDNYSQNNFQLHFIHQFSPKFHMNLTAHYTRGAGYYEQFKEDQTLADYGMNPYVPMPGDSVFVCDLTRRLWLDNHFVGGLFNVNYKANSRLNFILGGGANTYLGAHYGRVMWTPYQVSSPLDHEYYRDDATKNDGNLYLKSNLRTSERSLLFVDLQVRTIAYSFYGFDQNFVQGTQEQTYLFFNPKLGWNLDMAGGFGAYVFAGMGNKEPNRDDFVQSSPQSRPKPEQLIDLETGVNLRRKTLEAGLNLYYMDYRNQLVLNGQVNDVGAYNRVNVPASYRRGIEFELLYKPSAQVHLSGNICLSDNVITEFTEYLDSSNADYSVYTQVKNVYHNTPISFSPRSISSLVLAFFPVKNLKLSLINKNVSQQYLDNTGNNQRHLAPYSTLDFNVNYRIEKKGKRPEITLMAAVYNILNTMYSSTGYTYSYYYDSAGLSTFNQIAPAAPTNFLAGLSLKF